MKAPFVGQHLPGDRDPLAVSTARDVIISYLSTHVARGHARLMFIIDPVHVNLTRWVDLEEELSEL